jgi:pimeloyl-ACP methyl ester carboxylesterase
VTAATLDGPRPALRSWGDGDRVLLCLHPLGQEAAFFADLAPALGPGWRVASFDGRGHGAAAGRPVGDFGQFVDDAEAGLDRVGARHVAGFSMGGSVAALLAARRDLAALVLVATPHRGLPVFAERARAREAGSVAAVTEETVRRWFGRTDAEPAVDRARASLAKLTPEGFDAAWNAFATFRGYEGIAASLPPALCLAYGDDLSTPPVVLDAIAATIREAGGVAERETIPGAGHMGLLEKPRETGKAIARFLRDRP